MGEIAKSEWLKSPEIRPDMNLDLGEYVIMPNHIHGIIRIGENEYNQFDDKNIVNYDCRRAAMHGGSTSFIKDGLIRKGKGKTGPQRKNISSIIRGFKSAVTKEVRMINSDFGWQSRFYDCIIRDVESLNNIRRYINNNPKNWTIDEFNSENEKK